MSSVWKTLNSLRLVACVRMSRRCVPPTLLTIRNLQASKVRVQDTKAGYEFHDAHSGNKYAYPIRFWSNSKVFYTRQKLTYVAFVCRFFCFTKFGMLHMLDLIAACLESQHEGFEYVRPTGRSGKQAVSEWQAHGKLVLCKPVVSYGRSAVAVT